MSARKFRNSWWVDLRHNHQRIRIRSPENSRAGAMRYEATLRSRLVRGEPMLPCREQPVAKPCVEAFAWRWYHTYVVANNKPSEQKAKRLILRNHLVPCFGKLALDAVTALKVEEFKAAKLNTGLAPKSINNLLTVLAKCLRTAEEWGELDRAPKVKLLRVPPQKFDFLSVEEAEGLTQAVRDEPWHAMVTVALHTGLRLGELLALDWCDVDLDAALLTVRRSVFRNHIVAPKSNRIRHVPLTAQGRRALEAIQRPSGPVFSRPSFLPLSDQMARRKMLKLCAELGMRQIGWHVLRHSFASHLVSAGVSIKAVQELLGHSDVRTTMRYAHLAPSALRDAVRILDKPVAKEKILGQPVGNALTVAKANQSETPLLAGRF